MIGSVACGRVKSVKAENDSATGQKGLTVQFLIGKMRLSDPFDNVENEIKNDDSWVPMIKNWTVRINETQDSDSQNITLLRQSLALSAAVTDVSIQLGATSDQLMAGPITCIGSIWSKNGPSYYFVSGGKDFDTALDHVNRDIKIGIQTLRSSSAQK